MKAKLVISVCLLLSTLGTCADEYTVAVKYHGSKSGMSSCASRSVNVNFRSLATKSGVTYTRRAITAATNDCLKTLEEKLKPAADLRSCAEQAAKTNHTTFALHDGACWGTRVPWPVGASCTSGGDHVIYVATQLAKPSAENEPKVSNLSIGATYNNSQVIFNVTFNDLSTSRCFSTYQLKFDGQTKVVSSGGTVATEVTGFCPNLTFVLTRLVMGQPWGPSSLYQIPVKELPAPVINSSALTYQLPALNASGGDLSFAGVIQSDPCNLIRGFEATLTGSMVGHNDTVIEVPKRDTHLLLPCQTIEFFQKLQTTIQRVDGVQINTSFPTVNPQPMVSNFKISATYNGPDVSFIVTFNDQSTSRCVSTYQLQFDGQTKVVSSGGTVATKVNGSCTNLTFVLTGLFMGQPWGPSSLYQIPVGAPVVNPSALSYFNTYTYSNLSFGGVIQSDPCNFIRGFNVALKNSMLNYNDVVIEVPIRDTHLDLDCQTTDAFQTLQTTFQTVDGVQITAYFERFSPVWFANGDLKAYDRNLQACLSSPNKVYNLLANNLQDFCGPFGLQAFGEVHYTKGVTPIQSFGFFEQESDVNIE
ncbi:uncharacterized protein LOC108664895 [Hyalella azteca]|uniref:Uncharacterized protein LOC108664895 n=1 Tax=Hyalella azteca TaxID=294128 RepID=A0A979FIV3_HYAAZ|nr:uncharacterized protein LOC108664895 [Hyalella azteca]